MQRYPHHWHDGGTGHPVLHIVFIVALVVGIALVVWALLRMRRADRSATAGAGPTPASGADQALAELRLRYARGDIDRDDYLRRAVDLGDTSVVTPPPTTPPEA